MKNEIQEQIMQYYDLLGEWNAAYEEYAKSVGLSYTALTVLRSLYENENCTQKELAEDCFLPKQTVNAIITSCFKNGWVELKELPEDRRHKTVNFTVDGKEKMTEILSRVQEIEQKAMEKLTAEERKMLLSLTKAYVGSCCGEMKNG